MNGFDDFDTQVSAEEFYADAGDYYAQKDAVAYDWNDHMAQWDNDPSPYDGTYSEE